MTVYLCGVGGERWPSHAKVHGSTVFKNQSIQGKKMVTRWKKWVVALASCVAFSSAWAELVFNVVPSGGDVAVTVSGSLNTAALTAGGLVSCGVTNDGVLVPNNAVVCAGPGAIMQGFVGLAGPTGFGPSGTLVSGTSASGDSVALVGFQAAVLLPVGYASGSALSGTALFAGATLTSLGLTPGTYQWTYGSGPTADRITVVIGAAAATSVPTLGEYALMALAGLLMLATLPALRCRA